MAAVRTRREVRNDESIVLLNLCIPEVSLIPTHDKSFPQPVTTISNLTWFIHLRVCKDNPRTARGRGLVV